MRSGNACQIRDYRGSGEKMDRPLGSFGKPYADEAAYRTFVAEDAEGKIKTA